jgi:hypothetical protein
MCSPKMRKHKNFEIKNAQLFIKKLEIEGSISDFHL